MWYIATFGLQAAHAYQSLGKEYAALLYAEESAAYFQPGASDPVNDQAEAAAELVKKLRESITLAVSASRRTYRKNREDDTRAVKWDVATRVDSGFAMLPYRPLICDQSSNR